MKEEYIFTFGCGHYPFAGKCVRIAGTYGDTRKKMWKVFGDKWAFQYGSVQWERMKNDPDRYYPMEEEIPFSEAEQFIKDGGRIGEY